MSLFATDYTTPSTSWLPSWLPSWLQPVPTPLGGVVLSADYDGCFDILFYLGGLYLVNTFLISKAFNS